MKRLASFASAGYVIAAYAFIYLPVAVLVLFSFQASRFPIPPFTGPSLRWYEEVLADARFTDAMWNSIAVGALSSAVAVLLGFLAAYGCARLGGRAGRSLRALLIAPLLVTLAEVLEALNVGRTWFYREATTLTRRTDGSGPKAPLWFRAEDVREWWTAREKVVNPTGATRP